jgi:hypothetical protein
VAFPTPRDRERAQREVDEILTAAIEAFLAEHADRDDPFSTAELTSAVAIPRFTERDAHLFLVALLGQGRVSRGHEGWRAIAGRA